MYQLHTILIDFPSAASVTFTSCAGDWHLILECDLTVLHLFRNLRVISISKSPTSIGSSQEAA